MTYDLVAMGRAFTDVVAPVDDQFLRRNGLIKGRGQELVQNELIGIRSELRDYLLLPGGSPSNTAAGVVALGGRAAFLGKVCNDVTGSAFRNAFMQGGVFFPNPDYPVEGGATSAMCLVLTTPDGAVTMAYNRGIADRLDPPSRYADVISQSSVLLVQGHLFSSAESETAAREAVRIAQTAKRKVAISLNDLFIPARQIQSFLFEADFVIGNRREYQNAFPERPLADAASDDTVFVITDGPRGALIVGKGQELAVPAVPRPVSTGTQRLYDVGPGNRFAAGFLLGVARGLSYAAAGALAAEAAATILPVPGARPNGDWSQLAARHGVSPGGAEALGT